MGPATVARGVLLAGLVLLGGWHLAQPEFWSPVSGVVFGSHEFGHLLFGFFGEWLTVAGGSLTQLLVPVAAAVYFERVRRDRLAAAICGVWLAISLGNLAVYIGDARAESLDLVSFSPDGAVHDWNYVLHSVGLIRNDTQIAGFTRFTGWLVLGFSALAGAGALRPGRTVTPGSGRGGA